MVAIALALLAADKIKCVFGDAYEDWQGYWQQDEEGRRKVPSTKPVYEKLAKVIENVIMQAERTEDIVGGLQHLLAIGNDESRVNNHRRLAARLYKAALYDLGSELDKIDKNDEDNDEGRDAARQGKLGESQAALVVARSISQLYPDLAFDVETSGQNITLFITAAQYGLTPIVKFMIELVSTHLQNEDNRPGGVSFETALHHKLNISPQNRSALCGAAGKSKYDVIDEILRVDPTLAEHDRLVENLLCPVTADSNEQREREHKKREDCVRLILNRCPSVAQPTYFIDALKASTSIAKHFLETAEERGIKMLTKETATWLIKEGSDQQWDICASYSNQWAENIGKEDLELLHLAVENRKVSVVRYLSRKFPNLAVAKAKRGLRGLTYPLQYNQPNPVIEEGRSDSSEDEHGVPLTDGNQATTEHLGSAELQAMKDIQDAIVPALIKAAKSSYDAHRILRLCKGKDVAKRSFEGN
jgi:hypothetical protein